MHQDTKTYQQNKDTVKYKVQWNTSTEHSKIQTGMITAADRQGLTGWTDKQHRSIFTHAWIRKRDSYFSHMDLKKKDTIETKPKERVSHPDKQFHDFSMPESL